MAPVKKGNVLTDFILYEIPKLEMVIKCFHNKRFICRLVECNQWVKKLNPVKRVNFIFDKKNDKKNPYIIIQHPF